MLIDTGVNVLSKHIEGLIATFPKISSISIGVPVRLIMVVFLYSRI